MQLNAQSQAVHRFCQTLVENTSPFFTDVPRILIAGDDLSAVQQLLQIGFPATALTVLTPDATHHAEYTALGLQPQIKDLRLWTPQEGQWDGIWASRVFSEATSTQRVLLAFFRGLKARGLLWVDWQGPHWATPTAHPLLRQSGFDVIVEATLKDDSSVTQGALARRVSPTENH